MASKIYSAATIGLDSSLVEVEVDVLNGGLHNVTIVGLPDTAIKESRDRVSSALKNSGFKPAHQCGRITVNLAPADLPKSGPIYDIAFALGFLLTTNQVSFSPLSKIFLGELALDGTVRPVRGVLPVALFASENNIKELYVPRLNAHEASVVNGISVYPIDSLSQIVDHLTGKKPLAPISQTALSDFTKTVTHQYDMMHIQGQETAKRALEIAAAGGHNILFNGPPGSGKTLLAKTLPSILPSMTLSESLEVTKIFSVSGHLPKESPLITIRPFRSPHHSASAVSLVGGGTLPRPGEISLSHRGVLFLDEFAEFPKVVLESLRQPLEDGMITVSRARGTSVFPAAFILIAAMNPCPCGNRTDHEKRCTCSPSQIARYQQKISGPIMDRIDIHIEVPRLSFTKLDTQTITESSLEIRKRVENARTMQSHRFSNCSNFTNSEMSSVQIKELCALDNQSKLLLKQAISTLHLSPRSYYRLIKVARTIADLAKEPVITQKHIAEAIQYRFKSDAL